MKYYTQPTLAVVCVSASDILTVSVGDGEGVRLNFGSDFAKGVTGSISQGSSISMSWYEDFS